MSSLGAGETVVIAVLLVCTTILICEYMNKWRHDR